jgi:hypothetical protein
MRSKKGEGDSEMFLMFLERTGEDEDVIQVGETEIESA